MIFLVRYGNVLSGISSSTLYQEAWQTKESMLRNGQLSEYSVETAIQAHFGDSFDPVVKIGKKSKSAGTSKGASKASHVGQRLICGKGRKLLGIVNRHKYKAKHDSQKLTSKYKARWLHKGNICEAWMARSKMAKLFGANSVAKAIADSLKKETEPSASSTLPLCFVRIIDTDHDGYSPGQGIRV